MTPYLQNLMGYPVLTAGLVLAPRGMGTMVAMVIVGRPNRIDPRIMVFIGFALVAISLWMMTDFMPDISFAHIVHTGLIQGFGLGFILCPLGTMTCHAPPKIPDPRDRPVQSDTNLNVVRDFLIFPWGAMQMMHATTAEGITQF